MPPSPAPAASSRYAMLAATCDETPPSAAANRAAATKSAPDAAQNTLRHARQVSSIGSGPTSSPGTVWKKDFASRKAQMAAGKPRASTHSSAATGRRGLTWPIPAMLAKPLPIAVHSSHVASRIPREISLPLKTWIISRMSTICPVTAVKPQSARAACAPTAALPASPGSKFGLIAFTGTRLEAGNDGNARPCGTYF